MDPTWSFLIVDDDTLSREILAALLAACFEDAICLFASDEPTAIETMQTHGDDLDAIFLDERLDHNERGSTIALHTRNFYPTSPPVLVCISGVDSIPADVRRLFDIVWGKPFPSIDVMRTQLETALLARYA